MAEILAQKKSVEFDKAAISDIPEITAFVEEALESLDCPMKIIMKLSIAIDEIYSNIVKFAYGDDGGHAAVVIVPTEDPHGVCLSFLDEGLPYNPLEKEDPDITLGAEEREIGGLGIFMVKQTMDDITYEYTNNQNILKLYKSF